MPERPSVRAVGGLSLGLVLGLIGGWLAGLLRAPAPQARSRQTVAPETAIPQAAPEQPR